MNLFASAAAAVSGVLTSILPRRNERVVAKRRSGRFNPYPSPASAAVGAVCAPMGQAPAFVAPAAVTIRPAVFKQPAPVQSRVVKPLPVKPAAVSLAPQPAAATRPAASSAIEFVVPQARVPEALSAQQRGARQPLRGALKPAPAGPSSALAAAAAAASLAIAVPAAPAQQLSRVAVPSPTISETLPIRRKRPARLSDPPAAGLSPMDTVLYASELIQETTKALREISAGAHAPTADDLRALLARLGRADTQLLQIRVETRYQAAMRISASEEIGGLICTVHDAIESLERRERLRAAGTPAPALPSGTPMDISVRSRAAAAAAAAAGPSSSASGRPPLPSASAARASFGSAAGRLSFSSSAPSAAPRDARDSVGSLATSVGPSASALGTPAESDPGLVLAGAGNPSAELLAARLRSLQEQVSGLQAQLRAAGAPSSSSSSGQASGAAAPRIVVTEEGIGATPRRLVQAAAAKIGGWLSAAAAH
eukprot:tig00021462_g21593.t2